MLAQLEKQPLEVVDYDFDMRDWFAGLGEDYITSAEVEITPAGGLIAGSPDHPAYVLIGDVPRVIKVWVSGGLNGEEYHLTVRVTTNALRVEELDALIRVEDVVA